MVFGKAVQLIGIFEVGFALFAGIILKSSMGVELGLLALGFGIFLLGRLIERKFSH